MDDHGDLVDSHHLHGHEDEPNQQEADTLVEEVQGAEENQVPGLGGWGNHECQGQGSIMGSGRVKMAVDPSN